MADAVFDPISLSSALEKFIRPTTFLRDMFTQQGQVHATKYIQVNKATGGEGISAYVNRQGGPNTVGKQLFSGEVHVAPYIYEDIFITPEDFAQAGINENPYDSEPSAQYAKLVRDKSIELDQRLVRREEQQIAEIIQTGELAVSGEDVSYTVDYGMPAGHTIELATTNIWGSGAEDKLDQIATWADLIMNAGSPVPTFMVLDRLAAQLLLADPTILARLDNRKIETGQINFTQLGEKRATYIGSLKGLGFDLDLYSYYGSYVNSAGTRTYFMEDRTLVMGSSNIDFPVDYGRIENLKAPGFRGRSFVQQIVDDSGKGETLTIESSPLPLLKDSTAIVTVDVGEAS